MGREMRALAVFLVARNTMLCDHYNDDVLYTWYYMYVHGHIGCYILSLAKDNLRC